MNIPHANVIPEPAPAGVMSPSVMSLPAGTRVVLEIRDPSAPSGFRCETPSLGTLVEVLAPAVVRYVAAARAEKERRLAEKAAMGAGLPVVDTARPNPLAPAGKEKVIGKDKTICKCGRRKTVRPGGKNLTCAVCNSAAAQGRRKAA